MGSDPIQTVLAAAEPHSFGWLAGCSGRVSAPHQLMLIRIFNSHSKFRGATVLISSHYFMALLMLCCFVCERARGSSLTDFVVNSRDDIVGGIVVAAAAPPECVT